jgi:F-type H+-transporting ATPase subunit b
MRRFPKILYIFLISLFAITLVVHAAEESSEHASTPSGVEHAEHHETIWQIAGKWINFIILVGILYYFLNRSLRIQDKFQANYELIQTSIESSRQAKEQAEQKLRELDQKLGSLNDEINRIKTEAGKQAEEEKRKILELAQKEAERIVALAHREIDTEVELAKRMLRKQVADSSVSRSRKIIESEMSEDDQKRLIEEYIREFSK